MKRFRDFIIIAWIGTSFIAHAAEQPTAKGKGAGNQPTAAELEPLQGTWEGVREEGGAGDKPREKITVTITGNSLHFHRDTNFWFNTTFTLPAGTNPKQLHATIKGCPTSQADSIGEVVGAIFKIEDGTLTLADYSVSGEPPKSFDEAPGRFVLKKVQRKSAEPARTK